MSPHSPPNPFCQVDLVEPADRKMTRERYYSQMRIARLKLRIKQDLAFVAEGAKMLQKAGLLPPPDADRPQ